MHFDIEKHTIYKCIAGSQAHGTATPQSDIDIRGICIPPKEYFLSYHLNFQQKTELSTEKDSVIYAISMFFTLAAKANPSILELLFVPDSCILKYIPKYMDKIMANKNLFLSKKIAFTYTGYATSQLKRIKNHKHWLLHPIEKRPTRSQFGAQPSETSIETLLSNIKKAKDAKLDVMKIYGQEIEAEKNIRMPKENIKNIKTGKNIGILLEQF